MSNHVKWLFALTLVASFNCVAADRYLVSASLQHEGEPFATPSVLVESDTPASITVSGLDGYRMAVTVTELAPDKLSVAAKLDSAHGSMSPVVVVHPGQPATVSVGDLAMTLTVKVMTGREDR